MKKKIFITGVNGFIGRNLKEQLEKEYQTHTPSSKELNLLDHSKVEEFLSKHQFDIVIHCATHNATRISTKDLTKVFYNNLRMFFNLVRCHNTYKKMLYFGSGAEYDSSHYIPKMKEKYFDTHVPINNYGFSKYIMSKYIEKTDNLYDLRLFGCFGKYEDWRIRFISNAICKAIFDLDITIRQNVYFDYLYINDLVQILKWFIEAKKISHKHFNVCTGQTIDLLTLAKKILKISGKRLKIKVGRKGLKGEYSGDNRRLLKTIGQFNFAPIDQAIKELYNWYSENKDLINKNLLLVDK